MIRVNCLCLKGFGNNLVECLMKRNDVQINKIYTRKDEHQEFYYPTTSLAELAKKNRIPIEYINTTGAWGIEEADLVIVSTFHRLLRNAHLLSSPHIVNIHPSLLPSYRGATPITWQVLDNVYKTGVTAHLIDSEDIDTGPIIFQESIFNPNLSDWQIRKVLANLSERVIDKLISTYPNYIREDRLANDNGKYEFSNKEKKIRSLKDATINIETIKSFEYLTQLIKAFDNYPKLHIKTHKNIFIVDYDNFNELLPITIENEIIRIPGKWQN